MKMSVRSLYKSLAGPFSKTFEDAEDAWIYSNLISCSLQTESTVRRLLNTWCMDLSCWSRRLHFLADVQIYPLELFNFLWFWVCGLVDTSGEYACDCLVWLVEAQSLFLLLGSDNNDPFGLDVHMNVEIRTKTCSHLSTVSICVCAV